MRATVITCCLLSACVDEQNLGFTAVGAPRWAITLGTLHDDRGEAVAMDSIGDVVVAGEYGGPLNQVGISTPTGYVTKRVASDGSERWTVELVTKAELSYVEVRSVAVDAQDSIFVTGNYIGTVDFGGQTLSLSEPPMPSHNDMFLAKYSRDGHLEWVHGLSPTTNVAGISVTVDSVGRIVVTGTFNLGSLTLNGQQYTESDGDTDAYVIAFDPNGSVLWGHAFQGKGGPVPASVAVDESDDVLVTGGFSAPASFGGAVLDPAARDAAFLTRFRKDGLFLSSRVVGTGASLATQVVTDTSGLVAVQTVEQDPAANSSAWVHEFDGDNQELWSAKLADNGSLHPQPRTLVTTPSGEIVSSAWDDRPVQGTGSMELVSFDQAGHSGSASFGSRLVAAPQATIARSAAVGSTGATVIVGEFAGQIDLGSGPLNTRGHEDTDVFVVLLDPPLMH